MRLSDVGERRLLELLREWTEGNFAGILLGAGDDAALLAPSGSREIAVSTDAFVEGVHFTRDVFSPEDIGHKAMAAALSDLAAMGAEPLATFVNLFAPPDTALEFVRGVYIGLAREAREAGAGIAGGDTTTGPFALGLTVVGTAPAGGAYRRGGARPGDAIFVTGTLGKSEAGRIILKGDTRGFPDVSPAVLDAATRAHRRPSPRFDAVRLLRAIEGDNPGRRIVGAMIDVSDGLGIDLARLGDASSIGWIVEEHRIPVDEAARRIARGLGRPETDPAFGGGEDFELVMTIDAQARDAVLAAAARAGANWSEIGVAAPRNAGRVLQRADGTKAEWPDAAGYDHYRREGSD